MSRRHPRFAAVTGTAAFVMAMSLAPIAWGAPTSTALAATPEAIAIPAIFDSSSVHEIQVAFDETDYDAMVKAYQDSGQKELDRGDRDHRWGDV